MTTYKEFHARSISDPEGFWGEQAAMIDWHRPYDKVLDYAKPPFRSWFSGGLTNLCHNAVDRHLAKRGDQKALVWISTEVNEEKSWTFSELADEVNRFAAILVSLGVGKGDRVLIYMPMVPEAVFAMLATVRIGAIHSVVFGGFAAASLAATHRRCAAEGDGDLRRGLPRRQGHRLEAPRGRVDPALGRASRPRGDREPRTRPGDGEGGGAGPRLRGASREAHEREGAGHLAGIERAFLHPLHERHDRKAQGRAARHRRLCRGARRLHEAHLLLEPGGGLLFHLRHRLGRGAFVHRLRSAHQRLDHDHVRGPADPPRPGHLVEDRGRLQGHLDVLLAHGDPGAQEAGPGLHVEVRREVPQVPLSRRRAARRAHGALGGGQPRLPDRGQLLADRNRLADPLGLPRRGGHAAQVRLSVVRGLRLQREAEGRGHGQGDAGPTRRACCASCRRCRRVR